MSLHSIGYLFREGLKSLWKNRTMTIASVGVLIACLLMTGVAGLLSMNLSSTMTSIEGSNTLTVYLREDVPSLTAVRIGEELRQINNIAECTFVPKDDALSGIMQGMDSSSTLFESFTGDNNPLPDAYEISLEDLSLYDQTISAIKAVDGVDRISDYRSVAVRLSSLDRLVRYCSIGIVTILAVVSLFIIANTVRVAMFSRRLEISIMKSVGATNWFVRIPFIVEGVIIGLVSGGLASLILNLVYDRLISSVQILNFFTPVPLDGYRGAIVLSFLLIGTAFGALGGIISIGRYLKKDVGGIITL